MFFSAQKNIQDEVALRRALESPLLDVFKKDFLLFGYWIFCRRHQCLDFSTAAGVRKECNACYFDG